MTLLVRLGVDLVDLIILIARIGLIRRGDQRLRRIRMLIRILLSLSLKFLLFRLIVLVRLLLSELLRRLGVGLILRRGVGGEVRLFN